MSFFVNDPEPVANVTTTCGAAWDNITSFPSDWIPCQDSSVDWKLSAFAGIESFELQVKHSYVDVRYVFFLSLLFSCFCGVAFGVRIWVKRVLIQLLFSVGPPPQDIATTFAKATFGSRNLTCKATYCTLNVNETAKLPVWAATA